MRATPLSCAACATARATARCTSRRSGFGTSSFGPASEAIVRAALDTRARRISREMYVATARVIASLAGPNELVPNPLRRDVHRAVARAVAHAAQESGVARIATPSDYMQGETGPRSRP